MSKSWKIAKSVTWIFYVFSLFCVLGMFTIPSILGGSVIVEINTWRICTVLIWVFGGISFVSAIIQAQVRGPDDDRNHIFAIILDMLLLIANLGLTAIAFILS